MLRFNKDRLSASERDALETSIIEENIHKGRILAHIVVVFEMIYIVIDIISKILKVDSRFNYDSYLGMYCIMIFLNVVYLLAVRRFKNESGEPKKRKLRQEITTIVYLTLVMSWGSVISLMDQRLYGQLMTFMVNMITCSVIYLMDTRQLLIPYSASVLGLFIGLPFFQKSRDILIGHYVNLLVFIVISWVASRIIYCNFCENYKTRILIKKSNLLLENKIEENRKINIQLEIANEQMKELALLDDLTGIPNRRSFREFIDRAFQTFVKKDSSISIIMIDIDFFKQYNDYYGHSEGDKILIATAGQINAIINNTSEYFVRWGGEEFIYAAFNKAEEEIREIAETIRIKVEDLKIPHGQPPAGPYVTVSLGTCTLLTAAKQDVSTAIRLADQALYLAKSAGRNCVKAVNEDVSGPFNPVP
jgi:diguanylate cyclase (GGDEF) domain